MATKHENILKQVRLNWTSTGRGKLFPIRQVSTVKEGQFLKGGSDVGIFDLIGSELIDGKQIACMIDAKTASYYYLSKYQKLKAKNLTNIGWRCYIAFEWGDYYKLFTVDDYLKLRPWTKGYKRQCQN